ncbi:MAG: hypothetical protein IJ526_05160, partial [Lachnospiraceae bacterium]|nr:hypothetical protein [Lachnospiraceae bacterium]
KNKGHRCRNLYLYENQLTMILLSAVKNLMWKYNAIGNCMDALNIDDTRKRLKIKSHEITSINESDVGMLIKGIRIKPYRVAEIIYLDESTDSVLIEDYSPREYRKVLKPENGGEKQ